MFTFSGYHCIFLFDKTDPDNLQEFNTLSFGPCLNTIYMEKHICHLNPRTAILGFKPSITHKATSVFFHADDFNVACRVFSILGRIIVTTYYSPLIEDSIVTALHTEHFPKHSLKQSAEDER